MTVSERLAALLAEVEADILGPRPRQIPKRWSAELSLALAEVEAIAGQMRSEAKMRMECENVAPDEYGYLMHQAARLAPEGGK